MEAGDRATQDAVAESDQVRTGRSQSIPSAHGFYQPLRILLGQFATPWRHGGTRTSIQNDTHQ